MRKAAALTVLCLVLCTSGCASVNEVMASWVGDSVSNLVTSWGPPQQVYDDGQGGRVLVYLLDRTYTVAGSSHTTTYVNGMAVGNMFVANGQSYTTYTPEHAAGYTAYRMFWSNSDGVIYRWQWKGL